MQVFVFNFVHLYDEQLYKTLFDFGPDCHYNWSQQMRRREKVPQGIRLSESCREMRGSRRPLWGNPPGAACRKGLCDLIKHRRKHPLSCRTLLEVHERAQICVNESGTAENFVYCRVFVS